MPLPVQFRLLAHRDRGLKDAPTILARNLRGSMEGLGKRFRNSAQSRMREDTGKAKESLVVEVKGKGLGLRMTVYSKLVQAFVDAYGRPPGKFPPFRKGSKLYKWTERKTKGFPSADVTRGNKRAISHLTRRPQLKVKQVKKVKSGGPVLTTARLTARERSLEKMSFLMARHIYEHGIKATHWNTKALEANKGRILRDLKDALSRSVQEINRG